VFYLSDDTTLCNLVFTFDKYYNT